MEEISVYLDNVLIYSKDESSHMRTLEEIFHRLDKAGLTISKKKCIFGVKELDFVGYKMKKIRNCSYTKKAGSNCEVSTTSKTKATAGFPRSNQLLSPLPRKLSRRKPSYNITAFVCCSHIQAPT